MGLLRQALRLVPAVATFAIGYYIGTIESGEYGCIFPEPTTYEMRELETRTIDTYDQRNDTNNDTLDKVISYDL